MKYVLTVLVFLVGAVTLEARPGRGADLEVYVVYSGKNKDERNALLEKLSGKFRVKTYNVDLLAVADYSGKQKVLAKLSQAPIIIFMKDTPSKILKGNKVNRTLLLVKTVSQGVRSTTWSLHVLEKGAELGPLGNKELLEVSTMDDLGDVEALKKADAVIVDGNSVDFYGAVSTLLKTIRVDQE